MRLFSSVLCLLAVTGCAPVDITRDGNDPLRADLERLLNEPAPRRKIPCRPVASIPEPGRNAPEALPELIPKASLFRANAEFATCTDLYGEERSKENESEIRQALEMMIFVAHCSRGADGLFHPQPIEGLPIKFWMRDKQECGSVDMRGATIQCGVSEVRFVPGPDQGSQEDDTRRPHYVGRVVKLKSNPPPGDDEIPANDFDPETTLPNTGFQFKTGEVDPPPPSLQEMTQMNCSRGERILRTAYAREVEDIHRDYDTQMDDARRKLDPNEIIRGTRLAMSDRGAALDEARQNFLWKLDQIHKNCHRTLH